MATLYRDQGWYYINFRVDGKRLRKALKTKSQRPSPEGEGLNEPLEVGHSG